MGYSKISPLSVIIFLFVAIACHESNAVEKNPGKPSQTTLTAEDKLALLKRALDRKKDSSNPAIPKRLGQEVEMGDALSCIGIYEGQMYSQGLDRTGGFTRNITELRHRKITTSEDFAGVGLLEWMTKILTIMDHAGIKDIGFELHLGIYTDGFLQKYIPGADAESTTLRNNLKSRITIFIVPHGFSTFKKIKDVDDISAFELGGVQP